MKTLRAFVFADALLLTLAGLGLAVRSTRSLPAASLWTGIVGNPSALSLGAAGLGVLAVALWLTSDLPRVGHRRRLTLGLSFTNFLMYVLASVLRLGGWWSEWGAACFVLWVWLAWVGLQPPNPEAIAAEIAGLKIPDEARRALLQQVGEAAAQEERNRLARDLHDSINQQLFSINVGAAAAQERWESDAEGVRKALADIRRSAREALVEMQAMLHQLRPEALGTAGLVEALREQCEALSYQTGAEVTLEVGDAVPDDRMPPGSQNTLFRIGQEMLANVARHARARYVRLWLGLQAEEVVLQVVDDGQGFDPAAETSGLGLRHLNERAETLRGRIEIASSPSAGTRVEVRCPLIPAPAAVELAQLMLKGLWNCVIQVIGWASLLLVFKVPLVRDTLAEEDRWNMGLLLGFATLNLLNLLVRWFPRHVSRLFLTSGGFDRRQVWTLWFLGLGIFTVFLLDAAFPDPASRYVLNVFIPYPVPWYFWAISLVLFSLAAAGVIKIHQTSRVRRFWRKEARILFWLVLPVETGILAAAGLAAFDRLLVNLQPVEILLLLLGGATFAYLASRQPCQEGAL